MSRHFFVVDKPFEVKETQTTWRLMVEAAQSGAEVFVLAASAISLRGQNARVRGRSVHRLQEASAIQQRPLVSLDVASGDTLWLRTSPGRNTDRMLDHVALLGVASQVADSGVRVINAPRGLLGSASKLYLAALSPELQPRSVMSRDVDELAEFARSCRDGCVFKPAFGTRGAGVFLVRSGDPNVRSIAEFLASRDYVVAQQFVPEAAAGDTRLVVVDGEVLSVEGIDAALQRIPAGGDFRSNLHAGGSYRQGVVTAAMRSAVKELGPRLLADGIVMAGIDFIGDLVIEVNTSSPGGLYPLEQLTGLNFTKAALALLLR